MSTTPEPSKPGRTGNPRTQNAWRTRRNVSGSQPPRPDAAALAGGASAASLAVVSQTLSDAGPLASLAVVVRVQSPVDGAHEYPCIATWNRLRPTRGCTWDLADLPAAYRRAVRHLVGDLADSLLAPSGARGAFDGREDARP